MTHISPSDKCSSDKKIVLKIVYDDVSRVSIQLNTRLLTSDEQSQRLIAALATAHVSR